MFKYPPEENILEFTVTNEQNLVYVDMRQMWIHTELYQVMVIFHPGN